MTKLPENILLIDKPIGITSFDVVRRLRKKLNIKKIGHAGTLDPLATGLMVLGIGKGTKLLNEYIKLPKVYEAEICIGESTTTGDREGEVIQKTKVKKIKEMDIKKALSEMIGVNKLPVSPYSAIKRNGEPLYKKARRGEHVKPPIREMLVYEAKLLDVKNKNDKVFLNVLFNVGSGTYVRSLAEKLGEKLMYPARLENLRRTQVGEFDIKDAEKI